MVLERIAEGLGYGWDPELIALAGGPFVDRLRDRGLPVEVVGAAGRWGVAAGALRLRSHLRRTKPALIHANGVKAALVAVLAEPVGRIPIVWMKHDFSWDGWPARVIARRCACVVGASATVLETFGAGIRTRVVAPGVSLPEIDRQAARDRLSAAIGLRRDAPTVAVIGRLDPIKGQREMLEAMPAILARHPGANLLVIGGVDDNHLAYGEELALRAEELGIADSVRMLGHRSDALELIAGADVVAIPTVRDRTGRGREGFGLVAVEAMALGTPVVAYELGALPDTLAGSGTLVKAGDREALAGAVSDVLGNSGSVQRMTERGIEIARGRYSVARMVEDLTGVYSDVLETGPADGE